MAIRHEYVYLGRTRGINSKQIQWGKKQEEEEAGSACSTSASGLLSGWVVYFYLFIFSVEAVSGLHLLG